MTDKKKNDKTPMTPEQKLEYFMAKRAWWSRRHDRFLTPAKKANAIKRIAYYDGKIAALDTDKQEA
jgi:hypothetical protein